MTTVYVEAGSNLSAGAEFLVYSTKIRVGDRVKIGKALGPYRGAPVADGVCTGTGDQDPKSPVTPTTGGRKANAWRNYRKIRVERMLK